MKRTRHGSRPRATRTNSSRCSPSWKNKNRHNNNNSKDDNNDDGVTMDTGDGNGNIVVVVVVVCVDKVKLSEKLSTIYYRIIQYRPSVFVLVPHNHLLDCCHDRHRHRHYRLAVVRRRTRILLSFFRPLSVSPFRKNLFGKKIA